MEKHLHNVGDLPAPARSVVEGLMGRPLRDNQQVFIVAFDDVTEPPAEDRRQAWQELAAIIADTHARVRQTGATANQLEQAIDEACDEVRFGRKS